MKKQYNETAEKLYNEARDAGLYNVAEIIKTQYKVNRRYKTLNEWLKTDIEKDCLVLGYWGLSYFIRALIERLKKLDNIDKEAQSLINETFSSFILNGDEEFPSKEEARASISVNYGFVNDYVRKVLPKLGYQRVPIEEISVNIENCSDEYIVEYLYEDKFAFQFERIGNIFGINSPGDLKKKNYWIKQ